MKTLAGNLFNRRFFHDKTSMNSIDISGALTGVLFILSLVVIGLFIERIHPARQQPSASPSTLFNLFYTVAYLFVQALVVPLVSASTMLVIHAAGGGWFVLPDAGWGLLPGFVGYALTVDFMEYLFHRMQHRVPAMWAMHSFHHSDTMLNASTTNRHFWAEHGIKMMTIYLLVGLLLKAGPVILGMYALLSIYNIFLHMNMRVGYGRWAIVINSPQYHRLHHSILPEHYNHNFAALFPIFDVIFGTCRMPDPAQYPPTGLDASERPVRLLEAIFWPVRNARWMRRRAAPDA